MRPFSFIHCADIHLGCRPFDLAERCKDFKRAFDVIVDAAVTRGVDFVIIAGDLFHQRSVSADTLSDAVAALSALKRANIRCYCIEGNHDRAATQGAATFVDFLDKQGLLRLLRPSVDGQGAIRLDNAVAYDGCCRIIGLGYLGATAPLRLAQAAECISSEDSFTLCVLHAGHKGLKDTDMSYVPTEGFAPLRDKAQYIALGHAHQMRVFEDWLFTPGAPEHVHIDEAEGARKGFFYARVAEDGKLTAEHIPSSPRVTRLLSLDVTGACDTAHLEDMIERYLSGSDIPEGAVVRLRLYGDARLNTDAVDTVALSAMLRERWGCLHAIIEPMLNSARYKYESGAQSLEAFERGVLRDMLLRSMPGASGMEEDIAGAVYRYKEGRAGAEELLTVVEAMIERTHEN